jgi:hypothetical protein
MSGKPAEGMYPERRIFRRVPVSKEILISAGSGGFTAMMANLSLGGLFAAVSRRMKVAVGDQLLITIPLSGDAPDNAISVSGTVVRVEKRGIAVKFQEMDRMTFHTLLTFINRYPV